MKVRIVLFARAREICDASEIELELDPRSTAGDCFRALAGRHPRLQALEGKIMVAINERYAEWSAELSEGDELALIPPVSGG